MSKVALIGLISCAREIAVRNPEYGVKLLGPNSEIEIAFDGMTVSVVYTQKDRKPERIEGCYCFDDRGVVDALLDGYIIPDQSEILWKVKPPIDYADTGWRLDERWISWLRDEKVFVDSSLNLVKE